MTTLLEIHEREFDSKAGVFRSRLSAALVGAQVSKYLHTNFPNSFDSRMVQVEGKKSCTIEFPRHRHVWWPKENSAEAIRAEMEEIAKIFKETENA